MSVLELTLVRHGESEANIAAAEAERTGADRLVLPARDPDVELSGTGRDQARAVGAYLAALDVDTRPQAIWVSTYRRARETAETALAEAELDLPVTVDERLRDRELGILDGYTSDGVDRVFPEEAERRRFLGKFYYRPPGGESWADVALRIRSVLTDLTTGAAESGVRPDRVLVVSHDAVTSLFRYVCEGFDEQGILDEVRRRPVPNASVTRLRRRAGESLWHADLVGDISHLARHDAEVTTHTGDPDGTSPS